MNGSYEQENEVLAQEISEQLQHKVRMRTLRIWLIGAAIILAVLTGLSFLLMKIFFSVKQVTVEGDGDYSAEEIFEASGVRQGDLMLFVNKKKAVSAILDKYVMIESAEISTELPDKLKITFKKETPLFRFEHESMRGDGEGAYAVVSASQKIIDILPDLSTLEQKYGKLPEVRMPELLIASKGRRIVFKNEGDGDYIPALIELLDASVFVSDELTVDARVRFDIVIYSGICSDGLPKYELRIGNKKRIADKIAMAQSIAKNKLDANFAGEICVGADGDDNIRSAYARARDVSGKT